MERQLRRQPVELIYEYPRNRYYYWYYPRLLGDYTGDGLPDIVGFGRAEVYAEPSVRITVLP